MDSFDLAQSIAEIEAQARPKTDGLVPVNRFQSVARDIITEINAHLEAMHVGLAEKCAAASPAEKRSAWSNLRKDYAIWLEKYIQDIMGKVFIPVDSFGVPGDEKALSRIDYTNVDVALVAAQMINILFIKMETSSVGPKDEQIPLTPAKAYKLKQRCLYYYVMHCIYLECMLNLTPTSSDKKKQEVLGKCMHWIEQLEKPTAQTIKILKTKAESLVMGKVSSKTKRALKQDVSESSSVMVDVKAKPKTKAKTKKPDVATKKKKKVAKPDTPDTSCDGESTSEAESEESPRPKKRARAAK